MSLTEITNKASGLPSRWLIYGTEGIGKTTLATRFPSPVFLMAKGETGLDELIKNGQVGEIPHLPECLSWADAVSVLDEFSQADHQYKTLVIDTINGLEQLATDHVRERDYNNSAKEFTAFQQGSRNIASMDWRNVLVALDRVREERKMTIVALAHARTGNVKNPSGPDYDQYMPAMAKEVAEITNRWADAICFMDFEIYFADETKSKGKAMGGTHRMMYTQKTAGYVAKNRMGLPPAIDLGDTPDEAWEAFSSAVRNARKKGATQ